MERLHDEVLSQPGPGGAAPDLRACYHCTMTLAFPDGNKVTVTDILNGKLVWPPRGEVTQGSWFYAMFVAEGEAQTLQEMNLSGFEAMANSNHRSLFENSPMYPPERARQHKRCRRRICLGLKPWRIPTTGLVSKTAL